MHLRKIRRMFATVLLAAILATGFVPSALASISVKVNSSAAKAYKSASTKAKSVKVAKNMRMTVTAVSGSWAKVSYKGKTGYMPIKYLTATQKTVAYTKAATTAYNSSGKKIGTVAKGTKLYVLGTVSGYYCVTSSTGKTGYVKTGTLTDTKPAVTNVSQTPSLSKVDKAILLAESLLGKKYSSSKNPPTTFDCSSFVQYCMEKAGYPMKGTSATQAADSRYQMITSLSSLKRGDILFFDTNGNGSVDHSAIYMGNNKFIEASRNAGKVQTNTLTSWYKSHFMWARRPG